MSRIVDVEQLGCLIWKDGEHGTTFDDGVLWVLEKIGELPVIEAQQWIPVTERLPEEGEDIIVAYVDDEETRIIPVNYGKKTWYDCIFNIALDPIKVIAWMPLPEPYQAERRTE